MGVSGKGRKGVLFVCDGPSKHDDAVGRYLADDDGMLLRSALRKCGFDLGSDGWATGAVICRTNGSPSSLEVGYCLPNLKDTIRELKPRVIIPMGRAAITAVVGPLWSDIGRDVERWDGWRIPAHAYNAWVCPMGAPHILKSEDAVLKQRFVNHLTSAVGIDGFPWPDGPPDYAKNVQIVRDTKAAADMVMQCASMEVGAVAWDFETDRLKPDAPDARIVSCALASGRADKPSVCFAFPWEGPVIPAMREFLRSPVAKIASNLKFEERWSRAKIGTRVRNWAWDTMLAAHVLDNRPDITSVKFQAFVRLGAPPWNKHIEGHLRANGGATARNNIADVDLDDLLLYNGLDAWLEYLVAVDQVREMGIGLPWGCD